MSYASRSTRSKAINRNPHKDFDPNFAAKKKRRKAAKASRRANRG